MVTQQFTTLRALDAFDTVLASNSPRRRELLRLLGVDFRMAVPRDVDEAYPADLEPERVPEWLARLKNDAYLRQLWRPGELVITADTVVIVDGIILGKPKDDAEARRMLGLLSGRTHSVVSGIAVSDGSTTLSDSAVTEVTFAPLAKEEIDDYVSLCRPLDKAGAYGIQEWIGAIGVSGIRGSFYNVMGLPLHKLYNILTDIRLPKGSK